MEKPRIKRAARTVIFDDEGRYAILEVGGGEYFKIPGGGVEPGETDEEAAMREAREEAGCIVELLEPLGERNFHESHETYGEILHVSVCYLARVVTKGETAFDAWEASRGFRLHWWDYATAVAHFEEAHPASFFGKEINPRDLAYLVDGERARKRPPKGP